MTKVCEKLFPMGSFPKQKSDGFAMQEKLKANLDLMIKSIGRDMQFVGIVSGKGTVRSGKSTLAQQLGLYWTLEVNRIYKVENTFDLDNILFKGDDLVGKALEVPKYSVLILDEGDDLTIHYWRELAQKLRMFFRKCGQLNLFIILIIPDFFELPRHYAVVRSNILINVYFYGEFNRGFFEFYSAKRKRELYFKGRKYSDYSVVSPDFNGRFINLYTVNVKEYQEKKRIDLEESETRDMRPTEKEIIRAFRVKIVKNLLKLDLSVRKIARIEGISEKTVQRDIKLSENGGIS